VSFEALTLIEPSFPAEEKSQGRQKRNRHEGQKKKEKSTKTKKFEEKNKSYLL
jgi:hypothetical protein